MGLPSHVSLKKEMEKITAPWTPLEVARCNDQVVRLALFEGAYHWHVHEREDELFLIVKGQITIHVRDQADIVLREGEVAVIPKGIEHCPESDGRSFVLMIEPSMLKSAGDP